jgi:hypothetical protein
MGQNFKPITKQLAIAAFILTLVTALSFGIRRVRLGAYWPDSGQSTRSACSSDTEGQHQSDKSINADAEPDYYQDDSYTIDDEDNSQYVDVSDWDEQVPSDDNSEESTDSIKYDKAVFKTTSFKGGYAKSEGKNGLQNISLSDNENIYITEKGEAWYVSKRPDGQAVKMQVQVDDITGEITPVGSGYYGKSEGSQGPRRIPMGEYENIYITGEGETWYVSEQPDGSTAKVQLEEDITGEIDIVDSSENK